MLYTVEERFLYFILLCTLRTTPPGHAGNSQVPCYVIERTVPCVLRVRLSTGQLKDRTELLHNLHRDRDLTLPLPPFLVAM